MTDGTATHCPYCALQCAMTLTGPESVVSGRDFPTNRGGLCQKGWTSASLLRVTDRITRPHVRGPDGDLHPVTWDAALSLLSERITTTTQQYGSDAVAIFGGGGLTNEKAYQLGKFARTVIRTANIDYNGRFCMASAAAAANRSLGIDRGLPFPLEDLAGAEAVLLLGSNLAETMPPAVQHLAAVRAGGGLTVVDPRRSATAQLTEGGAGVHLQPVPGTDLVVLQALLHIIVADGLADESYLAERTTGMDEVRRSVGQWWPERAETVCGVSAAQLRRTAHLLAHAAPSHGGRGVMILTGRGVEQSTQGTATVTAAINLALALGLPGRPFSGYGAITGQGNGQGGREHGQKADQLPGYRSITDPDARAAVAAVWGVAPESLPGPGLPAVQLLRRLGAHGGPKILMVHGSNLLVSAPDADRVHDRLAALELLVVCDFVWSETTQRADVVLPVTQWAEEEGTMTSLEGRIIRRRQALSPPDGVRSELEILADLAGRLGSDVHFDTRPEAVFDELARASAGGRADYGGLSHDRLDREPDLFWPCPDGDHPGTPRLFTETFPTPDGRARLIAVDHEGPSDDVRPDAPIFLITGRLLQHYQSGAQTRRVAELSRMAPGPYVEMHPVLADRLGLVDGDPAELTSERGRIQAPIRLTTNIRSDTVFMPFHWGGAGSANRITTDATDPISGMPEFKVCAVSIRPTEGAEQ